MVIYKIYPLTADQSGKFLKIGLEQEVRSNTITKF